ncbi:nodulin-like, Major facilitator superfamily domain protein [Artemisia annua]|uniref:Nodulin-like, Major facilitator superfamily domain protein n=1 Tax=Artemisia annua TaxID=35608 RepID=A0A2U1LAU7_ARTAN|nr:nodulin-like, Major facilitator superfamily domain protein [Artemisia annua]
MNNLNDGDEALEVDVLLAVGERPVTFKNKRRPRRGGDFSFRETIVKANIWLLLFISWCWDENNCSHNLSEIGVSLGIVNRTTPLTLFSVENLQGHLGEKDGFLNKGMSCQTKRIKIATW